MGINPQEMISHAGVDELSARADDYFKAKTDIALDTTKPFHSLFAAAGYLESMGWLLAGLRLGKTMTVLDFGAGTCWFSRLLNQLQCCTISCDVSATALEVGRRLFAEHPIIGEYVAEPVFLPYDGHHIDLPDESVDRVICYDSFHHVPNQSQVLDEFARVLKPGGIAGFCEPGRYHSQSPIAQQEMRTHGVLENDIDINVIMAQARPHGFTDLTIRVLDSLYVTLDEYNLLTGSAGRVLRAPFRAMALGTKVLGNVRMMSTGRSVFFLHKGGFRPDSRSLEGLAHTMALEGHAYSVDVGEPLRLPLHIANTGSAVWLHENIKSIGAVRIGTHLYGQDGRMLNHDFTRHTFDAPVRPGEQVDRVIEVAFDTPGEYVLAIDLVSEQVCWFEELGPGPQRVTVSVR